MSSLSGISCSTFLGYKKSQNTSHGAVYVIMYVINHSSYSATVIGKKDLLLTFTVIQKEVTLSLNRMVTMDKRGRAITGEPDYIFLTTIPNTLHRFGDDLQNDPFHHPLAVETLHQLHFDSPDTVQNLNVLLEVRHPELGTGLKQWSHQSQSQKKCWGVHWKNQNFMNPELWWDPSSINLVALLQRFNPHSYSKKLHEEIFWYMWIQTDTSNSFGHDSGIGDFISKSIDDTKLCSAADIPEGQDAI
ncbi:hypothetical protein HGM15179_013879 [Zosterops borbonicus]|uniref:Uncharacterized protein n=1 Tax=Zosterops borbonicus TaxID=364589 RepID=A0A8K1G7A0_9PASS|nr:hypothetical protein HGM15179_013879 [Zosterops borbonicus]